MAVLRRYHTMHPTPIPAWAPNAIRSA